MWISCRCTQKFCLVTIAPLYTMTCMFIVFINLTGTLASPNPLLHDVLSIWDAVSVAYLARDIAISSACLFEAFMKGVTIFPNLITQLVRMSTLSANNYRSSSNFWCFTTRIA